MKDIRELAEAVRRGWVKDSPPEELARFALAVLDALDEAHATGSRMPASDIELGWNDAVNDIRAAIARNMEKR